LLQYQETKFEAIFRSVMTREKKRKGEEASKPHFDAVNSTAPAQLLSLVTTGKRDDEIYKSIDGCSPSTTFPPR
jgi:hypothetical protein